MYTINNNIVNEYEINKSKFITLIYKINNKKEINNIINDIKNQYKDATHYCYSYIINNEYHFSDDNEPGGTAGLPIYEVLKKNNLTNVLCVVVRYFGGIKLGAGGLIRAYTKSVTLALEKTPLKELVNGYEIEIVTSYEDLKNIEYLLKDTKIIYKEFNENIKFIIQIEKDKINILNNYNYKILNNIEIEKDL